MDLVTATVFYCFVVAGIFLGLWVYYDRRDHARFEAERRHASFHCQRCGHLYAVQGDSARTLCPKCRQENQRLTF